jgi:hypothetical protein
MGDLWLMLNNGYTVAIHHTSLHKGNIHDGKTSIKLNNKTRQNFVDSRITSDIMRVISWGEYGKSNNKTT